MKVSLARTGKAAAGEEGGVAVESRSAPPLTLATPKPMPTVSSSRPSNGAFRVTPALTLKLIRLRSPGAPISRANTLSERGLSSDGPPDHLVGHGVDAEVVPPHQRDAGAGRIGEREAGVVELLIGNGPLSYQKPSL